MYLIIYKALFIYSIFHSHVTINFRVDTIFFLHFNPCISVHLSFGHKKLIVFTFQSLVVGIEERVDEKKERKNIRLATI